MKCVENIIVRLKDWIKYCETKYNSVKRDEMMMEIHICDAEEILSTIEFWKRHADKWERTGMNALAHNVLLKSAFRERHSHLGFEDGNKIGCKYCDIITGLDMDRLNGNSNPQ